MAGGHGGVGAGALHLGDAGGPDGVGLDRALRERKAGPTPAPLVLLLRQLACCGCFGCDLGWLAAAIATAAAAAALRLA
jgi:hypothetical protein